MTIPATISGGPSIFQVRIGSGEVLSAGDEADVLLPFISILTRIIISSVRKGGIVLFDSDHVQPKPEWEKEYRHVGVPITSRTIEGYWRHGQGQGEESFRAGFLVAKCLI